jgi:hypothetical protein
MRMARNPRINREPQTVFETFRAQLERDLDGAVEQAEWGSAIRELLELYATLTEDDCREVECELDSRIALERASLTADNTGTSILGFLDAAASEISPSAPLLGILDPEKHGLATLTAGARYRDALTAIRERRADRLLSTAGSVFDGLYLPYLRALWRVLHPTKRADTVRVGCLLRDLAQAASRFPGLVLEDADRIRNADAHVRSKYMARSDSLALSDCQGWKRTMTVPELEQHVRAMMSAAGTLFPHATTLFVLAAVKPMIRLLPHFARAALDEDAAALAALGPRFQDCFSDLRQLAAR